MNINTPQRSLTASAAKKLKEALDVIPKASAAVDEAEANLRKAVQARETYLANGQLTEAGRKEFRAISDDVDFANAALTRARKAVTEGKSAVLLAAQHLREVATGWLRSIILGMKNEVEDAIRPLYVTPKQVQQIANQMPDPPKLAVVKRLGAAMSNNPFHPQLCDLVLWAQSMLSIASEALDSTEA